MSEEKKIIPRLGKAAREFNVATTTIVEFLSKKGFTIEDSINTKLTADICELLTIEYQSEKSIKEEAQRLDMGASIKSAPLQKTEPKEVKKEETIEEEKIIITETEPEKEESQPIEIKEEIVFEEQVIELVMEKEKEKEPLVSKPKIVGKVDLGSLNTKTKPTKKTKEEKEKEKEKEALRKEKEEAEKQKKEAKTAKQSEQKAEELTFPESEFEAKEEEIIQEIESVLEVVETPQENILPEKQEIVVSKKEPEMIKTEIPELRVPTVIGKLDLASINAKTKPAKKSKEELRKEKEERIRAERASRDDRRQEIAKAKQEQQSQQEAKVEKPDNFLKTKVEKLSVKVVDKIDISSALKEDKPKDKEEHENKKVKRKRIKTFSDEDKKPERTDIPKDKIFHGNKKDFRKERRVEISGEDVDLQIKKTMARMAPTGKTKASKHRREKRDLFSQGREQAQERQAQEKNILKVTEFITVNDLANMMDVPVNKIIGTCMSIGLVVAINQRLDAENIALLAEEYGFKIQFVGVEDEDDQQEEISNPENLVPRAPIVTVMGHVDHGKTSLLDYIRNANVIAGEAGGITQHIGAYEVKLLDKRKITFLDTPGHEAFTAMRARGAKITDIAIIVIAADDSIMPQTVEAINHAQAAGVPMIFAINKIDKSGADPDKIRTALANMNLLVEEWGGKIQSQDISAKKGINVDVLLEKILIEAEMLELKADPTLHATGTVIESSLDKGRGYVAKILIQNGTLRKSDIVVAGTSYGKIKAMYNERNQLIQYAGPSAPVLLLGLDSAPQAGDTFKVFTDEREAKSIVSKRQQLIREQGLRTQKHITLTEIGRRIAVGDFKELNIIVKGDVDGSIEALSDSLLRLTTEDVEVRVIHKSVGQVTESDVLLASASNAIIVAFQVRPSGGARKLAEQEQIDIRTYSVIYDAINEIKDAIEGMRAPEIKENIVCNIEVRETFRITKVGTIAGCYVLDGKIQRNTRIRVIRDGIVIYTGRLGSLKRFKDDVKEVSAGYECGLNIESFNDIKVGDIIEGFEEVEVKRT